MTEKQIKMMDSIDLLRRYFATESLETILNDWDGLNNSEFGGITIGEFEELAEKKCPPVEL